LSRLIWSTRDPVPRPVTVAVHLLAIVAIAVADYATGADYELRAFYLLPVLSAAWLGGLGLGIAVSILATISLFVTNDYLAAATAPGVSVSLWNIASRLTIYVVVTLLTVELRQQSTALRIKTDALIEEARLRDDYLAVFVHELRHSAAAMALASVSLASSPRLTADESGYVSRLGQQARDLERLAGQLLAIGRLEAATLALDLATVDLCELARTTAAESVAPGRLQVHCPTGPALVSADREELRRALDNLVRNALRHSPANLPVEISVIERDGMRGIEVSDRGVGFQPHTVDQLFKKYGRLSATSGGDPEGAGIGLYLTRLIVEAHGGVVHASSPGSGQGARFSFLLPPPEASE
jgi:signal transduction histidine kinase